MQVEPEDVVVELASTAELRALPASTQGMLRSWVVGAVGDDVWERMVTLRVRADGEIAIRLYSVADDGGYIIDLPTGTVAQEDLVARASGPFPLHVMGFIRP
ncbi:hypothetical protein KSP35_02100 [Aquihabitans sp. G128]|uniref:hypothetical protein n=1 Tax=Aquihabitans sp. G128 TaxID=2849779 RepID=UPI001C229973|nr:hypothetical protein [Aquihabitans sp. G128]QXC61663.1 hypothetical protein KSP35_02100 [Aquihabitans sp. G128]